jgi:hypothetical protein
MKPRFLVLVFLLAAGCGMAPSSPHTEAANSPFPSHVSATMDDVLAKARKNWQSDAIVTTVEMQWYPQDERDESKVQHWLAITLNSPSNGARRYVYVGGPYAGQIVDMPPDKDGSTIDHALPDFKFDLPQAIEFIRHAGLKDRLFFVKLEMVGASGTPPIAAWTIASLSDSSLFPLALDAQTGAIIPWKRAYNPPPFTDVQMRAAWDQVLNRNQPAHQNNANKHLECFMAIQEFGFCTQ